MEFDIQANWTRSSIDITPQSGFRYLVTDGDIIVIGTYIENKDGNIWIFSGLTDSNSKNFDVQGWMELPKLPKKIKSNATDI